MATITKDMTIMQILDINKDLAEVLMRHGMHCIGCVAASGETLEEACMAHGIEADTLINELNNTVSE